MTDFFELIKFDDTKTGTVDFSGQDADLTLAEQREYLDRFAKEYASYKNLSQTEPLVSQEECRAVLSALPKERNDVRGRVEISDMEISLLSQPMFRYLTLYTRRAVVKKGAIVFRDGYKYPVPCAELDAGGEIASVRLFITIGEEYRTPLRGGISPIVPGRTIEFRRGIEEIAKLQFYTDGQAIVRINRPDRYHHQNIPIGQYRFGEETEITVEFSEQGYSVRLDGGEKREFSLPSQYPDNVFFGGGAYPVGEWRVRPDEIRTRAGKILPVFEKSSGEATAEPVGVRKLPCCTGTWKNKRKFLVGTKRFCYEPRHAETFLCVSALDPGGDVFLNGRHVARLNDCTARKIRITDFLQAGENELQVKVDPRAPENICTWHRHKDPYFGWFIGKAYLESVPEDRIERVKAETVKIEGERIFVKIETRLLLRSDRPFEIVVLAERGEEKIPVCRAERAKNGKNVLHGSFEGKPWSPEEPNLYTLKVTLKCGKTVDEYSEITGFRTLSQKNGGMLLNGKDFVAKGALLMQYLPPYDEIPLNHLCPTDEQIVWQALIAKKMNCNMLRMHHLGYGMNDRRFARIFDFLGLTCVWTTRMIDSVASVIWDGTWHQKSDYRRQMEEVINSPSVVMWEGVNEQYFTRKDADSLYKEFVGGIGRSDRSRFLCPVSHLYYANDSYDRGCEYYQDDGLHDEYFRPAKACPEWNDKKVVRSAHPYERLLGYGTGWKTFRNQGWSAQPALLASRRHAYLVSEYAVIGRQNPNTAGAKSFLNAESYEREDEYALGYAFEGDGWYLSQAYQALAAKYTTKKLLSCGADGLLWCCLTGGANDGSYLKPPVDFHGYPKLAFYALSEGFEGNVCFQDDTDVVWGKDHRLKPVVVCEADGKIRDVTVSVTDSAGREVCREEYPGILCDRRIIRLKARKVRLPENGYYKFIFTVKEREML